MKLSLNLYLTMALAVLFFYLGEFLKKKVQFFRTYCIPSPVIGGLIFALLQFGFYEAGILELTLDSSLQAVFMNLFFTSVGFGASLAMVKKGGKTLVIFLICVALLICIQNVVGVVMCQFFGLDSLLGLCVGSIPLTGGHGNCGAFGPLLEDMGVQSAFTVAVASATYGLIAGNLIGNPIARRLILKNHLTEHNSGKVNAEAQAELEKNSALTHVLDPVKGTSGLALLFIALGGGIFVTMAFKAAHITVATYCGAMICGILIRNFCEASHIELPIQEISTIGNVSLNFFLILAMMSLKLQQLVGLALPMIIILLVQTIIVALFTTYVTFNACGRDYDAAVLVAGHCGFGMGATPNAMANMDALTKTFGPTQKAYLIVPITGGFFSDIMIALFVTIAINILA